MQFTAIVTLVFAALAVANPLPPPKIFERDCVGNLQQCNKAASAPVIGGGCCSGLYCCGVVGPNNVCQSVNNCGEPN